MQWLFGEGYEQGSDVLVIGKHTWARELTKPFDKYIFDVCDNHFNGQWDEHYRFHCENADGVTCNTPYMAKIIKTETGRDAIVIPDPFELPRQEPHFCESAIWFGGKGNLPALGRVIPDLPKINVAIVSEPVFDGVIPWSLEAMEREMSRSGISLIPVMDKPAASANRLIESLNCGVFPVVEPHPSHDEFNVWKGGIGDGVRWALNHPEKALDGVLEGQAYIDKHYSIEAIGPLWMEAIEGL